MGESLRILDSFTSQRRYRNADVLHCIVTRFDVRMTWAGPSKGKARFSVHDEWLAQRIEAFNTWCLPSILNQRVKPHAWFILIDRDLNRRSSQFLSSLLQHPFIIPLLAGSSWNREFIEEFQEVRLRKFGDTEFVWANCVRLDSDDSLHRDFMCASDLAIARLRENWQDKSRYCVNFPYGAVMDKDEFFVTHRPKFLFSLIEPVDQVEGMYAISHTKVERIAEITDVFTNDPMYLYQRHDGNVTGAVKNKNWRGPRLCDADLLCESFGIQPTILQAPPSAEIGGAAGQIG